MHHNPDDDGWRPPPRRHPSIDYNTAIPRAFARIEVARRDMHDAAQEMSRLLARAPQWQTLWEQFLNAGGISYDELRRFMVDKKRIRDIAKRQHLRMVAGPVGCSKDHAR